MPAWLLRFLPHALVVVAVIGAVAWIDHRGYQRAKQAAKFERAVTALLIDRRIDRLEDDLTLKLAAIDGALVARLGNLETVRSTIVRPAIEEALRNDPTLGDPARAIDGRLLDALNAAIEQSACPGPAAREDC